MKWQKEPPTEQGWYWWRVGPHDLAPAIIEYDPDNPQLFGVEWWPERIPEPKESE